MKNDSQRINNIIGQLEGIKKMMETREDCLMIVIQLKAVKSALNSLMRKIISENANDCLKNMHNAKIERFNKIINELIRI